MKEPIFKLIIIIPDGDIMFYNFVKSKMETGSIVVRPPESGTGAKANIQAKGLAAIAIIFLSRKEKEQIETLSKYIAMRRCRVSYCDPEY